MPKLFLSNVPVDCEDGELRQWVEAHGFEVDSIRVIRDQVANASPAFGYVALRDKHYELDAVRILNGQKIKGRALDVKPDWRRGR
jgi:hypothetical protein